ncbi:MAG: hypothetical protein AMXMBFR23_00640 [Chloroflexota bacterium]
MDLKIVPTYRRRGVGRRPERAPVLEHHLGPAYLQSAMEAATRTGVLVYPPLHPEEAIEVRFLDTGDFIFTMLSLGPDHRAHPMFRMKIGGSAGWGGLGKQELVYLDPRASVGAADAELLVGAITTNVMPGSVGQFGLLAAYNFITPQGWNSLCMMPLNRPRPDGIPSMSCFVETDWYPQNTEFRSVYEHGEAILLTRDTPLGQVLFLPRTAVHLLDALPSGSGVLESRETESGTEIDVVAVRGGYRDGAGRTPTHENRRAWLPQQARFCPVLEDLHHLGLLLYPPLHTNEGIQLRMGPDGELAVTAYRSDDVGAWRPTFVAHVRPGEGVAGAHVAAAADGVEVDEARALLDAVFTELNTPPGTVGLRASHRLATPDGFDTLVTAVFNEVTRPYVAPLTTRIETAGAPREVACWYHLQPGMVFSLVGDAPIGQAIFLSNEPLLTKEASPLEEERFATTQERYWTARGAKEQTTNYGATFTYHYRDHQKARRDGTDGALPALQDAAMDPGPRPPPAAGPGTSAGRRRRR